MEIHDTDTFIMFFQVLRIGLSMLVNEKHQNGRYKHPELPGIVFLTVKSVHIITKKCIMTSDGFSTNVKINLFLDIY